MKRARHLVAMIAALAVSPGRGEGGGDADRAARLVARTDDIAREVAKLRGLKIKKKLRRDAMATDALRARLVERFAARSTPEERAGQQLALERWGLVAPGVDVHDVLIDVLTEQIAGFYDAAVRTLYIADRADDDGADAGDGPSPDLLVAHEIVHALQDQHFDLEALTALPRAEADARLARQALIEGDAMVAAFELILAREGVAPPWGMDEAVTMIARRIEATTPDAADALARAPLVVRDLLMFPYAAGLRFVAALRARHAWKRVDAVYKDPPASTEQIMHPELYLAGDEPPHRVTARAPAALSGWRTVHETVWGEAGWSVLLREHGVDPGRAATAAAGWGGDRVVVYARPGDAAIATLTPRDAVGVAVTSWDADVDAMEFEEAVVDAVEAMIAGTIVEDVRGRTVWLGVDTRVSIVERRDDRVVVVIGAPLAARERITDEVWKTWKVKSD
jgi:hypothetical protein